MLRRGEIYDNPVTGERAIVRVGTDETNGERLVIDMQARPGAAGAGEHIHPTIDERFTVTRGRVGVLIDGRQSIAGPGDSIHFPPGIPHDWWNAGEEEAHLVLEIQPAARFEEMLRNLLGLAQDGRTNARGTPGLLQCALLAREFDDVLHFTKPHRLIQTVLFRILAPIARLRGYRGSYPEYVERRPLIRLSEETLRASAI
ncbi:MAG TPA: cupin domain-containing protein [Thermoanaerobaculia bacterium]|jgi:quercetin dioxygenase-like cupin family protein|nr:cupin domain-containing protein [Thermoanaerobaculia bacterium]